VVKPKIRKATFKPLGKDDKIWSGRRKIGANGPKKGRVTYFG